MYTPNFASITSRKKQKLLLLFFCAIILLLILMPRDLKLLKVDLIQPQTYSNVDTPEVEPLAYKCCTPSNNSFRTNVYFVKNHKTGSSTVQSVILRFAMLNSLDVLSLNYNAYYWPLSDKSIHAETITPNNKYHILAQHTRYDSKLKSYQYPDTPMVTLLRHPATLFQSVYKFFNMDKWMGMTFEQLLIAPVKPAFVQGDSSSIAYHGYNQMSVDLGFDLRYAKNDTAIAEFIEKIDREFDLVMITEYMDASFVLLANLMGWPLEYVAHVNLNVRPPESNGYKLTEKDKVTLMDLNQVDTLLYHHFFVKFQKCMQQYGEERLNYEISQLKIINQRLKEKCVAEEITRGLHYGRMKSVEYIPKNESDLECVYSTRLNPTMSWTARQVQIERLRRQKNPFGSAIRRF